MCTNRINLFGNPPFQEKPGVSRHCPRNPPTLRILMVIGNASPRPLQLRCRQAASRIDFPGLSREVRKKLSRLDGTARLGVTKPYCFRSQSLLSLSLLCIGMIILIYHQTICTYIWNYFCKTEGDMKFKAHQYELIASILTQAPRAF